MSIFSAGLHRLAKHLKGVPFFLADHNLFPVKRNRLCFTSWPDYGDNARALFDYMVEHGYKKKYEMIWLVENPEDFPDGIRGCRVYKVNSVSGGLKLLSSAYAFATHGFIHVSPAGKGNTCILLWHGCGYKGMEVNSERAGDYSLVIGPFWREPYARIFNQESDSCIPLGYPRCDLLLHPTESARAKLQALASAGTREKIILWMPTFRDTEKHEFPESKIPRVYPLPGLKSGAELERLNEVCREANIRIVIKHHPQQIAWDHSDLSHIKLISQEDLVRAGVQLYELLACTDALISDYSSVSIDFLLLDRPIGFVLDDYREYFAARGSTFSDPLRYMPGPHMMNVEDMAAYVRSVSLGEDRYAQERARCRKELHREDPPDSYCAEILAYFHL